MPPSLPGRYHLTYKGINAATDATANQKINNTDRVTGIIRHHEVFFVFGRVELLFLKIPGVFRGRLYCLIFEKCLQW